MAIGVGSGDTQQPIVRASGPQAKPKPAAAPTSQARSASPSASFAALPLVSWEKTASTILNSQGKSLEQLGFVDKPSANFGIAGSRSVEIEQTDHFYINGIRTDKAGAQGDTQALTRILQRDYLLELDELGPPPKPGSGEATQRQMALEKVKYELLYNPTAVDKYGDAAGTLADGTEAIENLTGADTLVAKQTAARFLATLTQGRSLSVVAHSQGGAIAADALRRVEARLLETHSRAEVKAIFEKQVTVRTLGGFAPGRSFPAGVQVDTVANPRDYIPKIGGNIYSMKQTLRYPFAYQVTSAQTGLKILEGAGMAAWLKFTGQPGVLDHHKTQSDDNDLGYINQIDLATPWRSNLPEKK